MKEEEICIIHRIHLHDSLPFLLSRDYRVPHTHSSFARKGHGRVSDLTWFSAIISIVCGIRFEQRVITGVIELPQNRYAGHHFIRESLSIFSWFLHLIHDAAIDNQKPEELEFTWQGVAGKT
ncbi:MAG: hypothetical protein LUQ69_08665 [Methanoregulaceae archaeon]|nr:hypothetical protein [Methanoregulaceae archaeon]